MPTLDLLKSVRCRNLLKHAEDEKSSGVRVDEVYFYFR